LNRVSLVQVFELISRRKTAAVEKNIFAAIVRRDKAEALLPDDFLDCTRHCNASPGLDVKHRFDIFPFAQ
jgi:hypothetical protein